jgi:hypothetical protein
MNIKLNSLFVSHRLVLILVLIEDLKFVFSDSQLPKFISVRGLLVSRRLILTLFRPSGKNIHGFSVGWAAAMCLHTRENKSDKVPHTKAVFYDLSMKMNRLCTISQLTDPLSRIIVYNIIRLRRYRIITVYRLGQKLPGTNLYTR